MKRCLTISLLLLVAHVTLAQDMLTLKSGKDLKTKITEIDKDSGKVKYKVFDNLEGPTYTEKISDVLMIRYQNGTVETFADVVIPSPNSSTPNPSATVTPRQEIIVLTPTTPKSGNANVCSQAVQDARFGYTGQNSGKGWTAAVTILLSPLVGLIPAIACSSTAPNDSNLNMNNSEMRNNTEYYNCYKQEAHNIKKKKVLTSFGVSAGVWAILVLLGSAG